MSSKTSASSWPHIPRVSCSRRCATSFGVGKHSFPVCNSKGKVRRRQSITTSHLLPSVNDSSIDARIEKNACASVWPPPEALGRHMFLPWGVIKAEASRQDVAGNLPLGTGKQSATAMQQVRRPELHSFATSDVVDATTQDSRLK